MKRSTDQNFLYRARAAWWEDGIPETLSGIGLLLLSGVGLLRAQAPPSRFTWLNVVWILLLFSLILGMKRLILQAKARWSWPRTGYSRPRRWVDLPTVLLILAATSGMFLAVSIGSPPAVGTGMGSFVLFLMVSLYRYARLPRFLWIGLLGGGVAFVLGLQGLPVEWMVHLVLGILGLLFLGSGIPRLYRTLSRPAEREQSHG